MFEKKSTDAANLKEWLSTSTSYYTTHSISAPFMSKRQKTPHNGGFWVNLLGPLEYPPTLGGAIAGGISATAYAAPLIR